MKLIIQFALVLVLVISCNNEKVTEKSNKKSADTNVEVADPPPKEVVDFAGSIENCGQLSCEGQQVDPDESGPTQEVIDLGNGQTEVIDVPPTRPQAIISFASTPPAKNGAATINFPLRTDRSDSEFECKLDSDEFRECPITSSLSAYKVVSISDLQSGTHSIQIRTSNYGSVTLTHTWENDIEKPNTIFSSMPLAETGYIATFNFHCTDDTSTLNCSFECSVDNASYVACASPYNATIRSTGSHNIKIRAIDRFAKFDDTPLSYNWNVDYTGPTVTTNLTYDQSTRTVPSIEITCSEENCIFECSLNNEAYKRCFSPFKPLIYSGIYNLRIIAKDKFGNAGQYTTRFEVDDTAPTSFGLLINPRFDPELFPDKMVISASCNDQFRPCSYYECQLNNDPIERCEFPKVFYAKGEGRHTLKAWAFDKAGNRSAMKEITWDASLPTRKLVMGSNVGCVLEADKQVYCFGNNTYSRLPFGYTGSGEVLDFVKIAGLGPVDDIVPHNDTFCALSAGAVLCWGVLTEWTNSVPVASTYDGQTYYSRSKKFYYPPIKMRGVLGFRHLTPHNFRDRYCGVNLTGNYVCAGENSSTDPLSVDSSDAFVYFPKLVTGLPTGAEVILSSEHCVATNKTEFYCKGDNFWGKAGFSNSEPLRTYKKHQDVIYKVIKIVEGSAHKCILDERGKIFCWGHGDPGVLGPNAIYTVNGEKFEITGIPGQIMDIAAGNSNACALNSLGTVYCWGDNSNGILGALPANLAYTSQPKQMGFPGRVKMMALGTNSYLFLGQAIKYGQLCVITEDEQTYCLGTHFKNKSTAPMTYTHIPFKIGGNTPPVATTTDLTCVENSECTSSGKTCISETCTSLSTSGGICDDNADCSGSGLSCVTNRCEMTNDQLREETRRSFVDLYQEINTRKVNLAGVTINTTGIYGCSSSYPTYQSLIVTKLNNLYTRLRQCADRLGSGVLSPTASGLGNCKNQTNFIPDNNLTSYGSALSENFCVLLYDDMNKLCNSVVSGGVISTCAVDVAYNACAVCSQ